MEAKCVICEQKPPQLENMYFAGRCLTKGYCPSNYNYSEANLTCVLRPTSSGGVAEDPPTVVPNSKSASSGIEILVIVVFIILFIVGFVILGRFCLKTAQYEVIATTSLFYESTRQIQYTEESPLNVSPEIDAELELSIGFKQPQSSDVVPSHLDQNPVSESARVSVEQQHQLSRESRPSSVHRSTVHEQNLEGLGDEQNPLAHIRFEGTSNRVGQVAEQNVDPAAQVPLNQPQGETPLPISNSGSRQNFGPSLQNNRLSFPRLANRNDHDSFEEMEEIPEEIHAD